MAHTLSMLSRVMFLLAAALVTKAVYALLALSSKYLASSGVKPREELST